MFFKTANVPIVAVYQSSGKFTKCAAKHAEIISDEEKTIQRSINLLSPRKLEAIAKVYDLSTDINDYIFPIPRAVVAEKSNSNGDFFSKEELLRHSPAHHCLVYETFVSTPVHIEHASEDPLSARGFNIDACYVDHDPNDEHVITIAAVDTTKDPPFAQMLLEAGSQGYWSMGCLCEAVKCSYCGKVAKSDSDLCDHLLWYKMATIDGVLVCEYCLGVEFQELSGVGDPAEETASTQCILQHTARKEEINKIKEQFNILSHLVPKEDQREVARYFSSNINRLPDAMLRLANKIL